MHFPVGDSEMVVDLLLSSVEQVRHVVVELEVGTFSYHRVATSSASQGQEPRKRCADLVIAATALAHGATLVTDDESSARAVSGLLPVRSLT